MMKYYILLLVIALFGLTSSCSKFLEESSQSELVPRTAESLNELLLGSGYQTNALNAGMEFYSDDITMVESSRILKGSYEIYSWQSAVVLDNSTYNEGYNLQSWSLIYPYIQICNTVLDYLPKVSGEPRFKDYVAGQAYLLRAFYYFKLVNLYGMPYNDPKTDPNTNLGVPLLIQGGLSHETRARNSVKEVYVQIEKDLLEGIRLVGQSGQKHTNYRIGSAAGHLLASRMYLYMDKWDEVIRHTDGLFSGPYTLMDLRNWGVVDPQTKPVISAANPETLWLFGSKNDNFYVSGSEISNDGKYPYRYAPDLLQSFEAGDLRKSIYIREDRSLKNQLMPTDAGQAFRLSEVYLNRAEAFAQLYKQGNAGAGQKCIDLLNALRVKRFSADKYVPLTSTTIGKDLLTYVREERRRELFSEQNLRWFDLRRYGMPRIEHIAHASEANIERYVLEERDPAYLLPIPTKAIEMNTKLVQNPLAPRRQPK